MCLKVSSVAPDFLVDAYERGADKPKKIHLSDFRGKWVVLFLYRRNFTFIIDLNCVVRHVTVNDMDVRRSVDEVLRTPCALKTLGRV